LLRQPDPQAIDGKLSAEIELVLAGLVLPFQADDVLPLAGGRPPPPPRPPRAPPAPPRARRARAGRRDWATTHASTSRAGPALRPGAARDVRRRTRASRPEPRP